MKPTYKPKEYMQMLGRLKRVYTLPVIPMTEKEKKIYQKAYEKYRKQVLKEKLSCIKKFQNSSNSIVIFPLQSEGIGKSIQ